MKILRRLFRKQPETSTIVDQDPFEAAQHGKTDVVAQILQNGFDLNSRSRYGGTLLHHAAQNLHYGTSRLLIEQGLDPDIKDKNGNTPADWACMSNEIRMGAPSKPARAYIEWLKVQKTLDD